MMGSANVANLQLAGADGRREIPVRVVLLAVCLCLTATACARAQQPDPESFLSTLRHAEDQGKAKNWRGAATLWEQVVKANPVDPGYWRQLAVALYNAKDYHQAIAANLKSLELGSSLDAFPWSIAYDIACNYARLGEKGTALKWLDKSWKLGWRDLKAAQDDEDLKALHDDPHFRELTALVDGSKMSRNAGWRYDLHLLAREIERRHYHPFRKTSREQFETAVKRLDARIPALRDNQIAVGLMRILAMVDDGHSVFDAGSGAPAFRQSVPLQFYLFEEGLFITSADPERRDLVGAQVLRIGDHSVPEVIAALDPIIGRENAMRLKAIAPAYMRRPPVLNGLGLLPSPYELPLTVRSLDGKERHVVVPANLDAPQLFPEVTQTWVPLRQISGRPLPLYLKNLAAPYWFEYLPESKILYFQFNQVANDMNEPFKAFVERMFAFAKQNEVEKMVIDMRLNGGGNTFLVRPLIHGLIRNEKISQRGKLFVIIGRLTYSAAMNTVDFIERNTEAIFVGEPTGSSPNFIGETARFTLPYSKLAPSVSDLYWESSWPMDHRLWIAPVLYTPPTFAAARENRDPAMEAILAYIEKP